MHTQWLCIFGQLNIFKSDYFLVVEILLSSDEAFKEFLTSLQDFTCLISASIVAGTQQQAALGFVPKLNPTATGLLSSANYSLLLAAQQQQQQQQQAAATAALFAAKGGNAFAAMDPLLQQAYSGIQQYAATFPQAFSGAGGTTITSLPSAASLASAAATVGGGGGAFLATTANDAIGRQPEGKCSLSYAQIFRSLGQGFF